MGSIMDSAYWTCDFCGLTYEWRKDAALINKHDCAQKRKHLEFIKKNQPPKLERLTTIDNINREEDSPPQVQPPKWHTFKGGAGKGKK